MRARPRLWTAAAVASIAAVLTPGAPAPAVGGGPHPTASGAADPLCLHSYAAARSHRAVAVRFGIDPGLAGTPGGAQLRAVPDNPTRDLAAVRRLRVPHKALVVRLNRLFLSDGAAGIARFRRRAAAYGRAGMDVEIQVRYHPSPRQGGNLPAWTRYVRRVVDVLGRNPHVVAMTITNEVNVAFSPNTSDGAYPAAEEALIEGVEAAHDQARRDHLRRLSFGFTYAYRFAPASDAAFFARLRTLGGIRFRRALGFVGLDFYPGTIAPASVALDGYRAALVQAAGVVRRCLAPRAGIGPGVPIWITETGVPTGKLTAAQQADALGQLVRAAAALSGTFGITDFRWFNLRDSLRPAPGTTPPLFTTDGLLRADYSSKPAFGTFRALIGRLGAGT